MVRVRHSVCRNALQAIPAARLPGPHARLARPRSNEATTLTHRVSGPGVGPACGVTCFAAELARWLCLQAPHGAVQNRWGKRPARPLGLFEHGVGGRMEEGRALGTARVRRVREQRRGKGPSWGP
jgi:hypothetical protein